MHNRQKGDLGESIACARLIKEGFVIKARNYMKKWGEIDIIAEKDDTVHFVEVKSVMVHKGQSFRDSHVPEENVHPWKTLHIRRMVKTYFAEKGENGETEFQFHIFCVYIDMKARKARIKWLKNIIL